MFITTKEIKRFSFSHLLYTSLIILHCFVILLYILIIFVLRGMHIIYYYAFKATTISS